MTARALVAGTLLLWFAQEVWGTPRTLVYLRQPGTVEQLRIDMNAAIPGEGNVGATSFIVQKVLAATPESFDAESIKRTLAEGFPRAAVKATYSVSRRGRMTGLASDFLGHPVFGPCLRNLALFYVPLPAGPVDVGSSWAGLRTVFIPAVGIPDEIPPIEVAVSCRLTGFEGPPDRPVARIELRAAHAPGAKVKATLSGWYTFDTVRGCVISGSIEGTVEVVILMMPVVVPVTVNLANLTGKPMPELGAR